MSHNLQFYIDGEWRDPVAPHPFDVIDPATEEVAGRISLGSAADVDAAVKAARRAFALSSQTTREERLALLERVCVAYERRLEDIATAIRIEMGSPTWFARDVQATAPLRHFRQAQIVLRDYDYNRMMGTTLVTREPIGVCALITPWNWPINQIVLKLAPVLATGCTCVVKPSEIAPLSAIILAEVLHDANVPAGVFNLVNGDGPTVGHAMSVHPDVDMVSFTGSTRAGVLVAKDAADTVKRVHQELGGKGANVILPGTDLAQTIASGVERCMVNSGQSCQAPTRLLVHRSEAAEAVRIAARTADAIAVGDPRAEGTKLGPVVSQTQFDRVQSLIDTGMKEGATLAAGGLGRPTGVNRGYYVRPTIFADVLPDMTIAQQEIFGPVLSILPYENEDHAVEIANGTVYGLSAFVSAPDLAQARRLGARLRAGRVYLNGAPHGGKMDVEAPFGGYKQSGNGREVGVIGFEEFLECKALLGYDAA